MGIIIKQSLKGSIWSYLGLIVGYINVGLIMPAFFMAEQIGLVQLFVALSNIFTNFSTLGFGNVISRMFPEFRNKKKYHNGFLFIVVAIGALGFCLSVIAFLVLKPKLIESNLEKSPLLVEYILLLIPMFLFRIFYFLFDNYNKVLHDTATGAFWNDFIHKTLNLFLIVLFAFEYINFREFFYGYIVSLSLPVFPVIIVLIKRKDFNLIPNFRFLNRPLVKEMVTVSAFGLINGLSGMLTNNVDKLLINRYLSLEYVGVFSVCALFATVIYIPSRSTVNISTGIIAQAWKNNDIVQIQDIYKKASLTQTILGTLVFAGIIVNLDSIFTILPENYSKGRWVLIFYSLGTLVRVSVTTGGAIIATSKFYRILSLIIVLQIVYTLVFHLTLIPLWGITGAAIAVFLTYVVTTIILVGFIKWKLGMFCYSYKHLQVLIFAILSILLSYIIPNAESLVVEIAINSLCVAILFIFLILIFNVSEDFNVLFKNAVKSIINFFK